MVLPFINLCCFRKICSGWAGVCGRKLFCTRQVDLYKCFFHSIFGSCSLRHLIMRVTSVMCTMCKLYTKLMWQYCPLSSLCFISSLQWSVPLPQS
uniref:Uncharacterized protein n=1 Tax=Callorhinchus milii TaxID=7868 RepID=A0A4W3GQ76_CALMI